ncbi:MAG: DUF4214 domain-containing protein [Oscillatoria sp. Prado101]|jgi:hypothetical protein|nr:DUF4214 domain-containing protein [Oscillatoria sp. Prado101]
MRRNILATSALLFTLSLAAPVQAVNSAQPRLFIAGQDSQEWGGIRPSLIAQRRDQEEVYDAINEIYRDVLERDADYGGLRNWVRKLERGATLRDIREEIARSREAQDRIRDLYREVLGREADAGGIRTWVGELADGDSLLDVRKKIADSQEAENAINRIYRQVLGRNADRDGMRTWKKKLRDGATLSEIRERIANSDEARQRRGRQRR